MSTQSIESTQPKQRYDISNDKRIALIDRIEELHDRSTEMHSWNFYIRSKLLAHHAVKLSKREEVYPMQVYGVATRLAALNPRLAKTAQKMIENKFASKEDAPRPLTDETLEIVTKTVEWSSENEDDTATLPRLAIAASMDFMEHKIEQLPPSPIMIQQAQQHEQKAQISLAEPEPEIADSAPLAPVIELQTGYVPAMAIDHANANDMKKVSGL